MTNSQPTVTILQPQFQNPVVNYTQAQSSASNPATAPVFPVTRGGTVFYVNPSSTTNSSGTTTAPQPIYTTPPVITATPFVPQSTPQPTPPTSFTAQDVIQLLSSKQKDHLPEWKLAQYNGDPLHWHEWFGQFKSAIDSAPLTDDVKLTYLKTLVTGKAKIAIAEFAYCGTMYKDALKTLERKFGQPHAVVSAYLDKLSQFPPVKMHNSDSIISYSATISSLVGVFRSLSYEHDLSSASLLGQAVQKLPPNMKEAWSMNTVKKDLSRPTLIDFNAWLKDKAEAHERMKSSAGKTKPDESPTNVTRTKTGTKVFASTSSATSTPGPKGNPAILQQRVSPAKRNILCGVARRFARKHRRSERNLLRSTSSAFLV